LSHIFLHGAKLARSSCPSTFCLAVIGHPKLTALSAICASTSWAPGGAYGTQDSTMHIKDTQRPILHMLRCGRVWCVLRAQSLLCRWAATPGLPAIQCNAASALTPELLDSNRAVRPAHSRLRCSNTSMGAAAAADVAATAATAAAAVAVLSTCPSRCRGSGDATLCLCAPHTGLRWTAFSTCPRAICRAGESTCYRSRAPCWTSSMFTRWLSRTVTHVAHMLVLW
jgi:hypothetical protein